ncbi:hypothetical protein [Streptococcus catagoni]|uniref:hypothetical protein n=1 Tax=Streptococcus catagoni TaxID=2654874 RepID=UPI001407F9C8|nr:hypothetical protein [Streptococcus catagoni]
MIKKYDSIIQFIPRLPKWIWFIVYVIILSTLKTFIPNNLLVITALLLGIGFRRVGKRRKQLEAQKIAKRIQDLKDTIHMADKQSKLLDQYLLEQDYNNFRLLADQLLPKINYIKNETYELRAQLPPNVYQRINKRADDIKVDTRLQLEQLQVNSQLGQDQIYDRMITEEAPELTEVYKSIQRDHKSILEKIDKADNKAELTALHESSMQHFYQILEGYLKMKASPKDYYNAEKRLSQALEALKQFDLDLDETLRKLNESDLKDFDVSLRLMQEQSKQSYKENL